jgi:hypothetical protein
MISSSYILFLNHQIPQMIPLLTYRFNLMATCGEAKAELQKIAALRLSKREFH